MRKIFVGLPEIDSDHSVDPAEMDIFGVPMEDLRKEFKQVLKKLQHN